MNPKSTLTKLPAKAPAEQVVKDIRRHLSAEDKIRIMLESLRGEVSIAELSQMSDDGHFKVDQFNRGGLFSTKHYPCRLSTIVMRLQRP